MVKAIREAVGNRADILFGTHGQFTASGALRMASAIEPYDPLWFEEPVPPDMPEVMAEVARGTSIPIATGERLTTKFEFARVIENRAATILQPDLGRSGGILETKKIAAMAEAYHIQIAPTRSRHHRRSRSRPGRDRSQGVERPRDLRAGLPAAARAAARRGGIDPRAAGPAQASKTPGVQEKSGILFAFSSGASSSPGISCGTRRRR